MRVLLELISFTLQLTLCVVIILIALPFIVMKVAMELAVDSLSNTSFIKRITSSNPHDGE